VTVNFALANYSGNNATINAALRAPNAKVAELIGMARAAGVSAANDVSGDGQLNLDIHAQGPTKNMSALVFSGAGKLQNANLKLPSLTKPVQVRNADLAFSQNSANLTNLAAAVGQTNATGNVTLKNFAAPQVQFTLNADKVDVDELKQLFAATPSAPQKKASRQDFWRLITRAEAQTTSPAPAANANAQPSMINRMTGGGVVSVGTIKNQELVLNNLHSNVTLNHGLITLNPLTADLYGGKESGNVTADLRAAQPVYTVNLTTQKVDANQLLSSVSSIKQTLYGLLAANVNATFSSNSPEAIARSLNGKISMDLLNGKLMNVDLLHELATVGQFAPSLGRAAQGFTNIVRLSGNFDVKNGVAQTNNLKAAIDGGTMAGVGLINLADQTLNMRVTAVLDKALSQQVGGTQVGGYLNTALANNQGELVVPVIVTGNLKHPLVAPDLQQIAQMKLKNMVPNTQNITGAITQILGGKGQRGGSGMPQSDLGGILGASGGKKATQQPAGQQPAQQQPPAQPQQPPAAGTQPQGQQQQQQSNPINDLLNKVLKKPSPTPTPTPQ
jgi:AsmA protein